MNKTTFKTSPEIDAEVARLYAQRSEKLKGKTADDFCRDHNLALIYLDRRPENGPEGTALSQLMKTLKWEYRTEKTIMAQLYGCTIVVELSPCTLHSFHIWGELFYNDTREAEPELFDTLECFAAFVMARWW
jgi:hypothetical protein